VAGTLSLVSWLPDDRWIALGLPIDWRALTLPNKVLTLDRLSPEMIAALQSGDAQRSEQELSKVTRLSFLQGQDLRHAYMVNAVLPKVDLRSVRTKDGKQIASYTNLQRADLSWAVMPHVQLDDVELRHAKLVGTQLHGGQLRHVRLDGANLSSAQLQDGKLNGATLSGANLTDANLQGADLSEADFRPQTDVGGVSLPAAVLVNANLQGAILRRAKLQGANLTSADLRGANLSGANLEGAILQGARLQGATLFGAVVNNNDSKAAHLAHADGWPLGTAVPAQSQAYRQAVNDMLAMLACEDAYVARGLGSQATMHREGEQGVPLRPGLGRKLLEKLADPKCHGLAMLPAGAKLALEREERKAPSAAK
jgi:uncharacterized protein YjbI with pentapeptide repeats